MRNEALWRGKEVQCSLSTYDFGMMNKYISLTVQEKLLLNDSDKLWSHTWNFSPRLKKNGCAIKLNNKPVSCSYVLGAELYQTENILCTSFPFSLSAVLIFTSPSSLLMWLQKALEPMFDRFITEVCTVCQISRRQQALCSWRAFLQRRNSLLTISGHFRSTLCLLCSTSRLSVGVQPSIRSFKFKILYLGATDHNTIIKLC